MIVDAAETVRCVEGCGDNDPSILAVLGLVVALMSAGIALMAWKTADRSLGIMRVQHDEFLKELHATADFNLSIELTDADDDLLLIEVERVRLVWRIGVKNTGDRAATDLGINFLVPATITGFTWVDQTRSSGSILRSDDEPRRDKSHGTTDRLEEGGEEVKAVYLQKMVPRFGLRTNGVYEAEGNVRLPGRGVGDRDEGDGLVRRVAERCRSSGRMADVHDSPTGRGSGADRISATLVVTP